jgi:Glycosyltransferases involved in cell wall biogenesis
VVLGARQHALRVIVVDDGSQDKTAELAKLAGARVLVHPQNLGKGAALKTGFRAAKDADIIITMDSDGQHEAEEIPKLLEPYPQW